MSLLEKSILLPWEKYQRLVKRNDGEEGKSKLGKEEKEDKDEATEEEEEEEEEEEVEEEEEGEDTSSDSDSLDMDTVIEAIPKKMRNRARSLLLYIVKDGRLSWNGKGEIRYKGHEVPRSYIVDLMKDSQYRYKHFQPVGYQVFYDALSDINVPRGLVRHWERMIGQVPAPEYEQKTRRILAPPGIRAHDEKRKLKGRKIRVKWSEM